MSRRTAERTFSVIYGPVDRLWCNACDKAETLPDLRDETVARLQVEHVCGSRTAPWGSAGLS